LICYGPEIGTNLVTFVWAAFMEKFESARSFPGEVEGQTDRFPAAREDGSEG
jgi:hypothetical protein